MITKYPLYINGEFIETKSKQPVINPASGAVLAEVAVAGEPEVAAALTAARRAFDLGAWRRVSLTERKNLLLKVSQGILDHAAELARLESENAGKPIKESTFMDIPSSARTFEHFANHLENYLEPEEMVVSDNATARLMREPMGVAVLIVPWNYPLLIACWKLAAALAAGNAVILKPSSLTPLSAISLAGIIHEAGFPPGAVNIISGSGDTAGKGLCLDKRVDMISFTGSNEVGRQIVGYSEKYAKKLIMELGGKSAAVVLEDADLEAAVNGSLCSIFLNQGQMCTAMSRLLVQEGIYDKFIADFVQKAKRIKLGMPLDYETQMGPLISALQRRKVVERVENAQEEGARLLCGGKIPDGPALKNGFFFEPTLFAGCSAQSAIFQEEVFGPVVCVNKFSTLDEAITLANTSDFGLACSLWTKSEASVRYLSERVNAGTVWVNTYGMFYDELPYGGFKQSGFGKELGREGFLEYTRLKNLVIDKSKDARPLVSYWYGL